MKLNTERFSGIFQVPQFYPIAVIGAGGIGADVIITAGKMGFTEIVVYDDDVVDEINIATQFHKISDIGIPKVNAIYEASREYSGAMIYPYQERVVPETNFPFPVEVVISAVDSIAARQDIWKSILNTIEDVEGPRWYIDCRMAAMEFQMYVVDLNKARVIYEYGNRLLSISDDDVEDLVCTEKATTFCAKLAAAHVGAELMHIVKNEAVSRFLVHNVDTQFLHIRNL